MFARMYAHMSAVPSKVKRGHHIPWNQSYRWFWTVIRMLRTEHGFTAGATGSLSHWAISPGPRLKLTWVCCIFPCYMPWSYSEEWNWHLWAAPRCPELTPAPATAPTNLLFLLPLPLTFTSPAELLDSHLDFRTPLCSPLNHMATYQLPRSVWKSSCFRHSHARTSPLPSPLHAHWHGGWKQRLPTTLNVTENWITCVFTHPERFYSPSVPPSSTAVPSAHSTPLLRSGYLLGKEGRRKSVFSVMRRCDLSQERLWSRNERFVTQSPVPYWS